MVGQGGGIGHLAAGGKAQGQGGGHGVAGPGHVVDLLGHGGDSDQGFALEQGHAGLAPGDEHGLAVDVLADLAGSGQQSLFVVDLHAAHLDGLMVVGRDHGGADEAVQVGRLGIDHQGQPPAALPDLGQQPVQPDHELFVDHPLGVVGDDHCIEFLQVLFQVSDHPGQGAA